MICRRSIVANMDMQAPFDRRAGGAPALSEKDIRDIVAFLRTLSDGFKRPLRPRESLLATFVARNVLRYKKSSCENS